MTTTTQGSAQIPGGLRGLLRDSAGIAVAMGIMNVATYTFQIVCARILGPSEYGAVAGLTALLMVIAVLQLGLQATAARRISAEPGHVAQIENVIMRVTVRAALALGAVMLLASPAVMLVLRLDSLLPAVLLAIAAVPLTIQGGQAGILQGERRWLPLALLYLAMGLGRVVIGTLCILWQPTATGAMLGIALGMLVPAGVGWWVLRRDRLPGETSDAHATRPVIREMALGSLALLAFFVLSNIDIVIARNVLSDHEAGLYAGGLILTKAVLFLPQFVVVVAFPSMSTAEERRATLLRSLALVSVLGALCTGGALVLSSLAMVFIGGSQYLDVESRLWMFAILGTLLSLLQLLVYSVLARQGTRSALLVGAAVVAVLAASVGVSTLGQLVTAVTLVDAGLFAILLALSLWRMRIPASTPAPTPPAVHV